MIVVVEGPDNAGKSTLISHIARTLNIQVVLGGGPGKSQQELNDRVRQHQLRDNVIFDRHPVVSQAMYNHFRQAYEVDRELVSQFYQTDILFVYCRGRPEVETGHQIKEEVDQRPDLTGVPHIETVNANYRGICKVYDEWALKWAHVNYRIGDGYDKVTRLVAEAMRVRFDPLGDIVQFHKKFGLTYDGPPRCIQPIEQLQFRQRFLSEEVEEYCAHSDRAYDEITLNGGLDQANYAYHLEHALDALVDEMYVVLGTAYLHGFLPAFPEAWRRVQQANMSKVRAKTNGDSKRGSTFDVVKPPEWKAPRLVDLVERNDISSKSLID